MNRLFFLGVLLLLINIQSKAEDDHNSARATYIATWKDEAILQMAEHRIPASITLAQGILESGDGQSRLAKEGNNHFGIKCHNDWQGKRIYEDDDAKGECFRKYATAHESYEDHSLFLKRKRYERLFELEPDDYKAWAKGLKECGYATNPKYPQLLITLIENFNLAQYDEVGMEYLRKNKLPDRNSTPVAQTESPKTKPTKKHGKHARSGTDAEERINITLSQQRQIELSDNRIKYIRAKAGDTQASIAQDMDMNPWQIRKYNDLSSDEPIKEGQIIYLQPKRNRSSAETHRLKAGETLWDVSQHYGIKLKKLYRYNGWEPGVQPKAGTTIKLRK